MLKRAFRSLVAVSLGSFFCNVAAAQTPPAPPTAPAPVEAGAPAPAPAETETPPPQASDEPAVAPELLDKARHHFKQAVAFTEAGNCEGAIVEFEASYRMVPRASSLYNIAQCQETLHRYDLAIQYYERYLNEADADEEDRPSVEAALRTLRNLLGTVHINVNVTSQVWIDDRIAGQAPGDVLVPAGRHLLELRADGYLPQRTEIQVAGREEVEVDLTLTKARTTIHITEESGLDPIVFWSGVTVTVLTGAVGSVFGGIALSRQSQGTDLAEYDPDRARLQEEAKSSARNADILFAVTGVFAVATTVVAFLTNWDGPTERAPTAEDGPTVSLVPTLGVDHAGLQLRGAL